MSEVVWNTSIDVTPRLGGRAARRGLEGHEYVSTHVGLGRALTTAQRRRHERSDDDDGDSLPDDIGYDRIHCVTEAPSGQPQSGQRDFLEPAPEF